MSDNKLEQYWDKLSTGVRLIPNKSLRRWIFNRLSPREIHFARMPLIPHKTDDSQLLSVLRLLGKFVYLPNFGNLGDSLIAKSTYDFFDKHHFKYAIRPVKPDDIMVYGGGGIWVKNLYNTTEIIEQMKIAKRVIILPSSVYDCPKLVRILNEKFTIFAREKQTYDYLKSLNTGATILLDEDMAFRLTSMGGKCKITPDLYTWQERTKPHINQFSKTAYFFRNDPEKKLLHHNVTSFDISGSYISTWKNRYETNFACNALFNIINQFDTIETDRLHIAVTAALLGKKVKLWDNSYGKCFAVYEHSLRKFKNIDLKR